MMPARLWRPLLLHLALCGCVAAVLGQAAESELLSAGGDPLLALLASLRGAVAWGGIGLMAAAARLGWKYRLDDRLPSPGWVAGTLTASLFVAVVMGWATSIWQPANPSEGWQSLRYAIVAMVSYYGDDALESARPRVLKLLGRAVTGHGSDRGGVL